MGKKNLKILIICILPFFFGYQKLESKKRPKVTVVIVIDQFAYNYIPKLSKNFKYGLKFLLDNGIFYKNAYYPNAAPCTPVGHSAMSTGTYPKTNGIAFSSWLNDDGKKVKVFLNKNPKNAVFSPTGTYDYGMSPKNIMVDTVSDQFILNSNPKAQNKVYSLSFKTNGSIPTAGQLGKAIWFDYKTGNFTSSKHYFPKLPQWLIEFNKEKDLKSLKQTSWNLFHPKDSKYYDFYSINNYDAAGYKFSLIKTPQKIDSKSKDPFELYIKTPAANQLLVDLTKTFINKNFDNPKNGNLLLWVSFSPLDKIGHKYGPDSLEAIDMIYHLDKQLQEFMNFFNKKFGTENVVFALTADHGAPPIPEVMQERGFKKSKRIPIEPIIKKINQIIEEKYGISSIIIHFKKIEFFLNPQKFNSLKESKQNEILSLIINFLQKQPGIKQAWTNRDLDKTVYKPYQLEYFFKMQRYPGRNGHIFCQPEPYCVLTNYKTGTSHRSPYEYDTHVPLIIYQKNKYENKIVNNKVWIPQLAPTLSKILNITKPSATTFDTLPEI